MTAEFYTIGPGFFPRLLAALLIIANIARLLYSLKGIDSPEPQVQNDHRPLLIFTSIFALYAIGNYFLGFTLSSIVFLYVLMSVLGNRSKVQKIIVCLVVTFGVKAIFKWVLVLPLPAGFWGLQ
jgi:putative tricarboxylic transport membrane protein